MILENDRKELKGHLKAIQILNDHEMDLRTWEILVLIALDEGSGLVALANKHKIPKSVFSRHVLFLCGQRRHKGNQSNDGAQNVHTLTTKLVEKRDDPNNLRTHALYLTRFGKEVLKEVRNALVHDVPIH